MQRVTDGIYRLGSKAHNFYIYIEGGAATVIDAGGSREWPQLTAGLAQLGLGLGSVRGIVLTHAHVDHIGFAAHAEHSGIATHTHPIEAEAATGQRTNPAAGIGDLPWWKPRVWVMLITLARAGAHRFAPVREAIAVEDGETVDVPGRPRLVFTPGHTPGHAAFYFPDRRAAFTGDALATMSLTGGTDGPQLMPEPFNADHAEARSSLRKLADLDTAFILPGHGDPLPMQLTDAVAHL